MLRLSVCIRLLLAVAEIGVAAILLFRTNSPFESVVIALLLLVLVQTGGADTPERNNDLKRRLIRLNAAIRGLEVLSPSEQEEYRDAQLEEQVARATAKYSARAELLGACVKLIVALIAVWVLAKSAIGL